MTWMKILTWVGAGVLMVLMMGCASTPAASSPAASSSAKTLTTTVYVANEDDNTVSVIDGASNKVVTTIPVGKWPHWLFFPRMVSALLSRMANRQRFQ